MRLLASSAALLLILALPSVRAFASSGNLALDSAGLAQLETRAEHAGAREQCYLYTELVQVYLDVAGRQMAAGDAEQAASSLKRVEQFAERAHSGLARDSKHLKDAEMLLHAATFHLGQILHQVSSEDKAMFEATMKQINKVHDELLAQVFSH